MHSLFFQQYSMLAIFLLFLLHQYMYDESHICQQVLLATNQQNGAILPLSPQIEYLHDLSYYKVIHLYGQLPHSKDSIKG